MPLTMDTNAPTDFDFVIGDWHVRHRRLRQRLVGSTEWDEFEGYSSTRKMLGGFGNVEDNLIFLPDGPYQAAAIRSYDVRTGQWSIWWLDGRFPGMMDKPVVGQFDNGKGAFFADDVMHGAAIRIRFLWSVSDADQPEWEQAFSSDGGKTWETNWTMRFYRKP